MSAVLEVVARLKGVLQRRGELREVVLPGLAEHRLEGREDL